MNNIIPIILGYNDTLYGSENDAIIIYNFFYNYYIKYSSIWLEPIILLNNNVKIENIIKYLFNYISFNNLIIIIYFSGHSNKTGSLKFYNNFISSELLINKINSILKNPIELYFIIDSCFSKNFILNDFYYNKINKISYLVSCMEYEYSKEIEVNYDANMFIYKNINSNNKIVVGIFTYYFIKLLQARKIYNLYDFKLIVNDKLWNAISKKYKQTIYYDELYII
jgi:hypothetical protein